MKRLVSLVLACCALFVVACGDDDDDNGGEAPGIDPGAVENASGEVSWCIGKDTSGAYRDAIRLFREENSNITVNLVELPESADEQRNQLVQRQRAESTECDILGLDVIWTAEFAAQDWLADVSDAISEREGDFIPSTLETAEYEGKHWGVPYHSNAGFIYYRTDQVDEAPATWEELYDQAEQNDRLVYQGARYEGLTVNFLELLYSAGGSVLSDDGETVEVDSQEARDALSFMAEGIERGAANRAVTTYMEEESRRAFERGNATFMRNWPYAYSLGKESDIADEFDIGNFPGFGGNEGASVLGGFNLAISAFSQNKEAALAFVNFASGPEVQKANFIDAANPPATAAPYDDPEVQEAIPFAEELKGAIEQGQARPVSPVYPQISEAIFTNVFAALQGDMAPDEAITKMKTDIEAALETF